MGRTLIEKLLKFETGEEQYESPILKVLRTEPSIISEMNRKRVGSLLDSFHSQVLGLLRVFGGALDDFLSVYNIDHQFTTPDEALSFLQDNHEKLSLLPWERLAFVPHSMPGLNAFLVELPLTDILPDIVRRPINTYISEYYNRFLASGYSWQQLNFVTVCTFVGESFYLRSLLAGCVNFIRENLNAKQEQELIGEMRRILADSNFGIPGDWVSGAKRRKTAKKKSARPKAGTASTRASKKKASKRPSSKS